MTFPTLQSTTRGSSSASATSHNVTLPATVNAGDILLARFTARGGAVTWDDVTAGEWTPLNNTAHGSDNNFRFRSFWKVCDGTEDGAVLSIGLASSAHAAWHIDRFSDAQAVESAGSFSLPILVDPDGPSLNPSWPAEDTYWVTNYSLRDGGVGGETAPTNYTGTIADGSAGGSGGVSIVSAYRQLNADSENPGAWSTSHSGIKIANTFAIRAGQVLSPSRVDVGITFFDHKVVPQLKPPLVSLGVQFFAPQVASIQVLAPPRLDVNLTFSSPAVGGGLIAPRTDIGVTFFAPTVVKPGLQQGARLDIGVRFFKPLVEGGFRQIPQFNHVSFGPFPGAIADAALYNNTFNAPLRFEDRWAVRGPLGYTDFQPFVASMYEFQAGYVWLRLGLDVPAFPAIAITQARVNIDVPDLRDSGEADIPIDGAAVDFTRTFNAPPDVVAQVINAVGVTEAPKVTVRQDITTTHFFAVCHTGDDTTASVAARIKWVAQGY